MTEQPATYTPVSIPPGAVTAPQLRVAIVNGQPVVELRFPHSNCYFAGWRLPYISARAAYTYICSARRAGRTDSTNGYKSGRLFSGGVFERRRVRICNNAVRIGCQYLQYSEIAAFAASQGWPKLPPKKKKKSKA